MQLFIRTLDSTTLCLEIESDNSIFELKRLVGQRTGVPTSIQRLVHGGRHLVDSTNIEDYGIHQDATVQMLLRLPGGDSMGVFIKVLGGKSIRLEVTDNKVTVSQLQAQLKEVEGLDAEKYELLFMGQKLDSNKTLASYQIKGDSTLEAVISTVPISIPKGRCAVENCPDRIAKIVGECRYCGQGYCSRHRLPESHSCDNLQCCRQESYEKNSSKLLNEKCVADKV
jgi:hypothetical protein